MKNILVTGGAGYIGSHTVVELHAAGYRPVIVDNLSNSDLSVLDGIAAITGQKPAFYQLDYQDVDALQQVLDDEQIEGVIHFAASKAVGESVEQPLNYYRNNVSNFVTLLELLSDRGLPVVFSSSCVVYGEPDKLPVTEETPLKPAVSPYGATKQMDEQILRDTTNTGQLKAIALRYFNPIGAHPSGHIGELPHGVPKILVPYITQVVAGLLPQLTVNGNDYETPDGTCIRDYIHVVDLARAHIAALRAIADKPSGYFDVFNIGTGRGNSVMEIITTFEEVTGRTVPYQIGPRRAGDIVTMYANADKAERELGWKAGLSLADSLRDAWQWQQRLAERQN
jgi:UDP-glucose 4-epimerase